MIKAFICHFNTFFYKSINYSFFLVTVMKTLKEKDKQSFLARKEEVYSLIMEMGSLLADYDYQWSNELRRKFERATSFLSSMN